MIGHTTGPAGDWPGARSSPLRVLLVEPSAQDATAILHALREGDLEADVERVSTEAEFSRALDERWDAFVVHYAPGAFSARAAKALADAREVDAPFIVLADTFEQEMAGELLQTGAADFLLKAHLARLPRALERATVQHRARRERESTRLRRRRVEQALRRSESVFRALVERSPVYVLLVDEEGRIHYASPSVTVALGYPSPDALVGQSVLEIIDAADRAPAAERIRGRIESARREVRWRTLEGAVRWVEVSAQRVELESERMLLLTASDVSERKELFAKMAQLDRMAAMGSIAAAVGHEINNPLAYVLSNVGFLQGSIAQLGRGCPPEAVAEALSLLDDIHTGAERIREVVRDLRTFSRGDEDAVGPVDLGRVLDASAKMVGNELRHRARLRQEIKVDLPVQGNASKLGQVFLNLLVNAAHAIAPGAAHLNEIRVRAFVEGKEVVVEVADTGSGILPQHLDRLFEPFFTTKPVGQGTGLGLPICRDIVHGHGGTISVRSLVGEGTTFTVRLPVDDAAARVRPAAPRAAAWPPGPARVLVVEDDRIIRKALVKILAPLAVTTAESGLQALERIAIGEQFDLILSDVMMPEMTAVELRQRLAAEHPGMEERLLLLTGGAFTPHTRELIERHPDRVLPKPFEADALRHWVAGHLTRLAGGGRA